MNTQSSQDNTQPNEENSQTGEQSPNTVTNHSENPEIIAPELRTLLLDLFRSSALRMEVVHPPVTPYEIIIAETVSEMNYIFTAWEASHNLEFFTSLINRRPTASINGSTVQGTIRAQNRNLNRRPPAYKAPPSETPSDATDHEVPEDLLCVICGRRQVGVKFKECVHAICKDCAKGMWRAKMESPHDFPDHWNCPLCRKVVNEVRKIGEGGVVDEAEQKVTEWILEVSKTAKDMLEN